MAARAGGGFLLAVTLVLVAGTAGHAQLRISDLDVYLNDHEITAHVVLLGAIPPGLHEGVHSGMAARVRFTVELWQYNRLWRDRLLARKVIDRQLEYNVVSKEYKVTAGKDDALTSYTTRELREAQRVVSELRSVKLMAAGSLDPSEVIYVRVRAESALGGENTFLTRMAGTAEETSRQSEFRTLMRVQ